MKTALLAIVATALLSAEDVAGIDVRDSATVTCNYPSFTKVARFRTKNQSLTKADLVFQKGGWIRSHVSGGSGSFSITFNCNCCSPQGSLCRMKCVNGQDFMVSAPGAKLSIGNMGNQKNPTYGDILFSSQTSSVNVNSGYNRRRLLQGGKGHT